MGRKRWLVLGPLKRAVKKLKFLLSFNIRRWRLESFLASKRRRSLSLNDRFGFYQSIKLDTEEEGETGCESSSSYAGGGAVVQRTRSYGSSSGSDDVDKKAEIFIANFRRQLLYERQVSLELRYYRGN